MKSASEKLWDALTCSPDSAKQIDALNKLAAYGAQEIECDICGDWHRDGEVPYGCQTGDGR